MHWGFPVGTSGKEPACQCGRYETRVQPLGQEDPLEKEMATHSSILAWRIPWRKEPGRLQSTGLQRVGHDWALLPSLFDHFQFILIHGPNIPGSYAILLFTALDFISITSHSHSWGFFFALCHKDGVICISEVIDISPSNLDSTCASSNLAFLMMYSAYKLNKQGDKMDGNGQV